MRVRRLAISIIVLSLGWCGWVRGAEAERPRYKLPLGRKIVYSASDQTKPTQGEGSERSTSGQWQATVVAENADGSRRVILRSASSFTQKLGGNEDKAPERVELGYADIFPDGRITPNPSLGMRMNPSKIFPPLPKDAGELAKGWKHVDDLRGDSIDFTADAATGAQFTFTGVEGGVISKIYQTTRKTTYRLDRAKGIITSIDGEYAQDYGFHTTGTSTMKLESDTILAADEAKELAADFEQFFTAQEKYAQLMSDIEGQPEKADATAAQAKSLLEKARDEVKTQDAKTALAEMLTNHDGYAKYAKQSADEFKNVLNKPSPDWSTTDIDGKPAKLADYRGKVVVMDFWYRGCGWCMYAMPQVKQLAADYKDKPVAVLGMNTDSDEKDARFVIDAFGLQYPTIKAQGIPEKYGVSGFPTLIIVDQEGVVRDVHVGYSPDLREKVGKKIDELLTKGT